MELMQDRYLPVPLTPHFPTFSVVNGPFEKQMGVWRECSGGSGKLSFATLRDLLTVIDR